MEKVKTKKTPSSVMGTRRKTTNATWTVVQTRKLPPLSTETYAFTSEPLQKKKEEIQKTIEIAEKLMAQELGQRSPNIKKKKWHIFGKISD